ncbi:MAG: hypothetical protein HY540_02270 [Deltaproteobacteria bacterium]|nr:hypothetical protein [Deltaproteobacteria bacterium]
MNAKIVKSGEFEKKREAQGKPLAPIAAGTALSSSKIVGKKVLSAQEEADRILTDAVSEATRLREEAGEILASSEAAREEARRQGFAEGKEEGLATVTEELLKIVALREEFYAKAEGDMISLVMAMTEKVIGDSIKKNPDLIRKVVEQALLHTIGSKIVVRVSSEDYQTMMQGEHEFRNLIDKTRSLIFREDEAISKGGCVVETEVGTIDAQLETQLAAIKKAFEVV